MEVGFVEHGSVFRSQSTLRAVVSALWSFGDADALEMKPLVRTVAGVATDHLRHLVVGAATVAVKTIGIFE